MNAREDILSKLRAAQNPFPEAPPRPQSYLPVAPLEDTSAEALLARFRAELERLMGQAFVVEGDAEARACVLDLLRGHQARHILAWDFAHIPVAGLREAIQQAGIEISEPALHDEFRAETLEHVRGAQVGLTGADAAVAATGTLVFTTGPGRGRLPTVLAPVHIAVIRQDQLLARLEDWVSVQRAGGLEQLRRSANVCLVSGPSRTGDIEMTLILGVHGPGQVQVVIVR